MFIPDSRVAFKSKMLPENFTIVITLFKNSGEMLV